MNLTDAVMVAIEALADLPETRERRQAKKRLEKKRESLLRLHPKRLKPEEATA